MNIDELLGFNANDPVQQLADSLVRSDNKLLNELIRIRRENMTQAEVAARLGISRPAVSAFERYDADPRLSTVRRYALAIRAQIEHSVTSNADQHASNTNTLYALWVGTTKRQPTLSHREPTSEERSREERPNRRAYHIAAARHLVK